ncbi:MAG: hypothetical protein Q9226_006190 [Calogaya cf. arnoldii]
MSTEAPHQNALNTNEILIDIHTRLINFTRRLDIGFASLNLIMAHIQLLLITYHGQTTQHEKSNDENNYNQGLAGLRAEMKSFLDNGAASQAIVTLTQDARERLKELMDGLEEVVGMVERLGIDGEIGDKDKKQEA